MVRRDQDRNFKASLVSLLSAPLTGFCYSSLHHSQKPCLYAPRSSKEGNIRFSPFASTVIYTSIPPLVSITSI
ncbi:hypothetical protein NC652_033815 [Populus alba x Populus x berolinensis]|uniref:Uncharacterized protein n=1 Tax=Populus alba x Populus x berolinensis TaxID=444605 RepID=A0AAD6Q1A2_9ROSI|nr:hypothetical protein NC652_033815 [Populus alba x Populus x berolinensis]KAJ6973508.1 hypothetical protein NC653_033746 [Populus alba x Populus x berolinensis]